MQAILLAAGRSSRMGHPKALTPLAEGLALARMLRVAADVGLDALVVLGSDAAEVRARVPLARSVVNEDPDAGRTGSLQVGLRAAGVDAAIVWPVDHPLAGSATLRALAATPGEWVVPTCGDRRGHPIRLGPSAIEAVLGAAPALPLRDALRGAGLVPTRLPVDDAGVLLNLDTPEDLARLRERQGI